MKHHQLISKLAPKLPVLVGALFSLPLIVLLALDVRHRWTLRGTTELEISGLRYIEPLVCLALREAAGMPKDEEAERCVKEFSTNSRELAEHLGMTHSRLFPLGMEDLSDDALRVGLSTGVSRGRVLGQASQVIDQVGKSSNLILDPELDTYYMVDMVLLAYPELLKHLASLRDSLDQTEERERRLAASWSVRALRAIVEERVTGSLRTVVREDGNWGLRRPNLHGRIEPRIQSLAQTFRELDRSFAKFERGESTRDSVELQIRQFSKVASGTWVELNSELQEMLKERISRIDSGILFDVLSTLLIWSLAAGAVWLLNVIVTSQLRQLAHEKHERDAMQALAMRAIENIFDCLLLVDKNGHIVEVNEAAKQLLGFERQVLIGKSFGDVIVQADRGKVSLDDMVRITSDQAFRRGARLKIWGCSQTGELIPVEMFFGPITLGNRHLYFASFRDLRPEVEQEARQNAAHRLAQLGEMAAGVAHEIRSPLAVISGRAQVVRAELAKPTFDKQKIDANVEKIVSLVSRIGKITNSLRSIARDGSSMACEPTSAKALLVDVAELCADRCKQGEVELRIQQISDDLRLECRSVQVAQVLVNLCNNAFDAVAKLPVRWISMGVVELSDLIEFVVEDSGTGIPDEIAAKIMLPFFSTKAAGSGTGIGLSLSRAICEQHGGELVLDRAAKNTRFVVRLPKSQQARQPSQEKLKSVA